MSSKPKLPGAETCPAHDISAPAYAMPAATPAETTPDPWSVMRSVTLPRHGPNEEPFQWVSVNDHQMTVPRDGQRHEVPLPVYEVIQQARAMADYAADRSDALAAALKRAADSATA